MRICYVFFCLALFSGYRSLGQNLFLKTQGENTTVCGDNIDFSIEVRNTSSQTLTSITVKSKLPQGITYVSETSTPASYISGSPADHPGFLIASLAAGEAKFITFTGKTDCSLVTFLNDNNIVDGLVHNETQATYGINGGSPTNVFSEPNGSESYNVFYPVLTLTVNSEDKEKTASRFENVQRRFTVTNTGNGSLSVANTSLEITREAGLTFISLTGGAFTIDNSQANKSLLQFTDFANVGDGDNFLEPNESFILTETVSVNSCSDLALTSNYLVKWGCNNSICNLTSNNSQDASLVQVNTTGSPSMMTTKIQGNFTFCQGPQEFVFEFQNTRALSDVATNQSNRALLSAISINEGFRGFTDISDFQVLNRDGSWTSITPSVTGSGSTQRFGISPLTLNANVAGLSDVDGDGTFSDIMPQDKITVKATFNISCPSEFSDGKNTGRYEFNSISVSVTNPCGSFVGGDSDSFFFDSFYRSSKLSGPTDVVDGQSVFYRFDLTRDVSMFYLSCSDGTYTSEVSFPSAAYHVTSVSYTGLGSIPFTQAEDGTLTITGGGSNGSYIVNVTLDCSLGSAVTASSILDWKAYFNCSGTCCRQLIGQESYEIFNHCSGSGSGQCLRTSQFTAERTTFGYAEPSHPYYFQLPATKLTRNSTGVRLGAGMETDNILAVAKGSVASGTFDNAHVEVQYTSPVNENIFQFVDGYFMINSGSGEQRYDIVTAPLVTQDGQIYYFDFQVEGLSTFTEGTTIDLYANFKIQKVSALPPGEHLLQRFRAFHYGVASGSKLGCESFGTPFSVIKQSYQPINVNFGSTYGCTTPMNPNIFFNPTGGISVDAFPNEFRPNTRITEIRANIPKGAAYNEGSAFFQISSSSNIPLAAPTIINNADGSQDLIWEASKLPVMDMKNTRSARVQFHVRATCFSDLPSSVPIVTNTSYNNYEFDEGNAQAGTFPKTYSYSKLLSSLSIQANITQDAFAQTVSWPVAVCESSSFERRGHVWLSFEPPTNVSLLSATRNGAQLEIETYDPSAPHKKLIKVGALNGACHTIVLTASYTNCKENVVDEINLFAGGNCGNYPTNPEVADCSTLTAPVSGKVFIRYKNADLSLSVSKINAKSNLCEPVPFEVDLLSSGIGNMKNVSAVIDLPQGIVFKPGTAQYQLPSSSTDWVALPDPTTITTEGVSGLGWNLSSQVLNGGEFVNQTRILLRFSLEATCSETFETNYDPGLPVIITAVGRTNCDDLVVRPFQSKIEINGFELNGNSLIPILELDEICTSGFAPKAHVRITNPGVTPSNAQELVVTLPLGVRYEGVVPGAPKPFSVSRILGFTRITWKLNAGIGAGQTISGYDFIFSVADLSLTSVSVETKTFIFGSGVCTATGEQCSLRATTGSTEVEANINKENCFHCQQPVPSFSNTCSGREAEFKTWNGGNLTVTCNDSEFILTNNGTADMVVPQRYVVYYSDAQQVVEDIAFGQVQLAQGALHSIPNTLGSYTVSRIEIEQVGFNTENSGMIVTVDLTASGSYCSKVTTSLLPPIPLTWNFGDGNSITGSNVKHTYENHGLYTISLDYCRNSTMTISYEALDCRILDLGLYGDCSNDPQMYVWNVYNPNDVGVEIEYQLLNSPFRGTLIAPPQTDTTFSTAAMPGNKTLEIRWKNERQEPRTKSYRNFGDPCYVETCDNCFSSFSLLEGKQYVLSAWVREESVQPLINFDNAAIVLEFSSENDTSLMKFNASGAIIDGWQRVWTTFTVPRDVLYLTIRLLNESTNEAFFDDVRIHPFNANMKSFVYDPITQKLMAELDENNYATFYEYDEEGSLIRVKKETERGVKTIQESRNNTIKVANE